MNIKALRQDVVDAVLREARKPSRGGGTPMAQAGASYNKAFFTNVDTQSVFTSSSTRRSSSWTKANGRPPDEQEADKPLLTYEKGGADAGRHGPDLRLHRLGQQRLQCRVRHAHAGLLTADVDVTDKRTTR
ncbi:MAG: hypothetical protein R3F59_00840 [Myxococcota bacterium]